MSCENVKVVTNLARFKAVILVLPPVCGGNSIQLNCSCNPLYTVAES